MKTFKLQVYILIIGLLLAIYSLSKLLFIGYSKLIAKLLVKFINKVKTSDVKLLMCQYDVEI